MYFCVVCSKDRQSSKFCAFKYISQRTIKGATKPGYLRKKKIKGQSESVHADLKKGSRIKKCEVCDFEVNMFFFSRIQKHNVFLCSSF